MRRIFLLASVTFFAVFLFVMGASYKALDNLSSATNRPKNTKTLGAKTSQEEPLPIITLTIDAGGGISSSYKLSLEENSTAFSMLEKAKEMGEIEFGVTKYDFGVMVNSINGFENNSEYAWLYFVNNEAANVAADQYLLKPGDTVQWRYVKPEF